MSAVHYIQHHPVVAFIVGSIHLAAAILIKISSWRIPPLIMDIFQVGAWMVTITVGIITILGAIRRYLERRRKRFGP